MLDQRTARAVDYALGAAGGAGGEKYEQRMVKRQQRPVESIACVAGRQLGEADAGDRCALELRIAAEQDHGSHGRECADYLDELMPMARIEPRERTARLKGHHRRFAA